MARKKKTKYEVYRDSLLRAINRQARKGYKIQINIPPTLLQLRKQGIKGSELTKQTNQLKKIRQNISKYATLDLNTGTLTPELPTKKQYPQRGELIYNNFVDDFLSRLSEDVGEFTAYGRRRLMEAYDESVRSKNFLRNLVDRLVTEFGKNEIGFRINQQQDTVDNLTTYVLYGSDQAKIQSATHELAEILLNSNLTRFQLIQLEEDSEGEETWFDGYE